MSRTRRDFWLYVLPAIAIYAAFFVLPIIQSLWFALTAWPGFGPKSFVGLQNFLSLFDDAILWISLQNTALFILLSFLGMLPLSFLLANSLARVGPRGGIYSVIIYLPAVVSSVAVAMMWEVILNRHTGVATSLWTTLLGSRGPNWFGDPSWAIYTVIFVNTWQWTGLHMLIFAAAIKNVPSELYEAAQIDGAGPLKQMISVTLPMVAGTIQINMVLIAFGALRAFDLVFILTGGGPIDASQVPSLYMYQLTFTQFQFGPGSAIAVLVFLLAIVSFFVIRVVFWAMRRLAFIRTRATVQALLPAGTLTNA